MITVVVADDEPLIRSGLVMLLAAAPELNVVAEASDGSEAVSMAHRHQPDVLVMDLRMPIMGGVVATRALCREAADHPTKVLILTTFHDDESVLGALLAGASGYLLKQASPSDLAPAVRRVAAGDAWLDPSVAVRVLDALSRTPVLGRADRLGALLTGREREVLVLLAEGLSNAEISERLFVGIGTVKTHVSRILMKTGSRDRSQVVALAYRSGLVVTAATPAHRP